MGHTFKTGLRRLSAFQGFCLLGERVARISSHPFQMAAALVPVPYTPSSGRVATPASGLQMPASSLRHEDKAAAAEYEALRAGCAGHRDAIVISKASGTSYLAEGAMSVLFTLATGPCRFAVKFDKGRKWAKGGAPRSKAVASIGAAEIDVMCMLWYMLSARGVSPHVPRVFGVLPFSFGKGAAPYYGASGGESHGVVMELMGGYEGAATVKDLLKLGMAGRLVREGVDTFDDTLRVVVFQVLYTIAMWNTVTGANFRHNDLHAMNVCLTYWNEEHTAVDVEYHLPAADGTDRVFRLRTPLCATIIDFGYSAVLPGAGGPVFDPRFYYFGDAPEPLTREGSSITEPKFVLWGMSHRQPSRHYDVLLFAYAILHDFNARKCRHPASVEFRRFYARSFGTVHSCAAYMYQKQPCNGRLTPHGQQELMRTKTVTRGAKNSFTVMDAADALMDVYFARFRSSGSGSGSNSGNNIVFGLQPSPAAVAAPLSKQAMMRTCSHVIFNEEDRAWKPRLSKTGTLDNPPRPGLWSHLVATLDRLKAAAALPRPLTRAEAAAWSGGNGAVTPVAEEAEEAEEAWENCAPQENL